MISTRYLIYAGAGALAGLYFILAALPGLIASLHSGVIVKKSYGAARIERAIEPERFWRMWWQRAARGPGVGLLMVLGGTAYLTLSYFAGP